MYRNCIKNIKKLDPAGPGDVFRFIVYQAATNCATMELCMLVLMARRKVLLTIAISMKGLRPQDGQGGGRLTNSKCLGIDTLV